ncbi:MAG: PKD domain-containing protein [Bacteroidetes bacterium]|nr:PKD domain-containing protein [Bacteroidota bacterium]
MNQFYKVKISIGRRIVFSVLVIFYSIQFGYAQLLSSLQLSSDSLYGFDVQQTLDYLHRNNIPKHEHAEYIQTAKSRYKFSFSPHQVTPELNSLSTVKKNVGYSPSQKYSQTIPTLQSSSCVNMDFETGNFTGWTQKYGDHPNGVPVGTNTINAYNNPCTSFAWPTCPQAGTASPVGAPLHNIVSGGFDPTLGGTLLPQVAPGGNFSVVLGDYSRGGGYAAQLEQTFFVTSSNSNFTYQYAAVVHGKLGYHTHSDQAFFRVDVYDANNQPITCAHSFINPDSVSGFNFFQWGTNTNPAHYSVYWKPWTTVNVDLSNYQNQNVTIRFTTSDCAPGGHFAYAYIDASCNSTQPLTDTLCVGATKTIYAPQDPTFNYSWAPSGETTSSININTAGTYTVTITPQQGCPMVRDFNVPFHAMPLASYNLTQAICSDSVTLFDASTISSGNINKWKWLLGNATHDSLLTQNTGFTFAAPGVYTASLQVTSDKQCKDDTTFVITIAEKPVANFTCDSVCFGNNTSFLNLTSSVTVGNITNWNWSFGDVASGAANNSFLQDPTHLYSGSGFFNTQLYVETDLGCKDSITKQVVINDVPIVDFLTSNICFGSAANFANLTTVNSSGSTMYSWDFGDNSNFDTSTHTTHTYAAATDYTVTLVAATIEGCADSVRKTISLHANPVAGFIGIDTAACGIVCATLNDTSFITNGSIAQWIWSFSDGSVDTIQQVNKCFTTPGLYSASLTVVSDKNCSATVVKNNIVEVYPLPIADYTTSAETTTTLDPMIIFMNHSIGGQNYIWYFGDGDSLQKNLISDLIEHTYQDTGVYATQLIVITEKGCRDTAAKTLKVNPDFVVYIPNAFTPNSNGVNDFFKPIATGAKEMKFYIYDRWGLLLFNTNSIDGSWDGTYNGRTVPQDVYICRTVVVDIFDKKHVYNTSVTLLR